MKVSKFNEIHIDTGSRSTKAETILKESFQEFNKAFEGLHEWKMHFKENLPSALEFWWYIPTMILLLKFNLSSKKILDCFFYQSTHHLRRYLETNFIVLILNTSQSFTFLFKHFSSLAANLTNSSINLARLQLEWVPNS